MVHYLRIEGRLAHVLEVLALVGAVILVIAAAELPGSPSSPTQTLAGPSAADTPDASPASSSADPGSAPSAPPVQVCGNSSLLTGPSVAPSGSTVIPAGNNSDTTASYQLAPNTTYWLAPGVHTLGTGPYSQFQPDQGDTFLGAPGAILDGQSVNQFAFTDNPNSGSPNVTIEYLTIENFVSGQGEGVVNQAGQPGWTVKYNTVGPNEFNGSNPGGAGVMLATNNVVEYNCLSHNGEYGFSSFGGSSNITLSFNEIAYNDAYGGYDQPSSPIQCGCSGGGKFWITTNATVSDNYVHDNGNVGVWVDTDNAGFLIAHNFIADNYAEGVIYEISYNGLIENNTFLRNSLEAGPLLGGFPDSALYISESGFDDRVVNPFHASVFLVEDNVFTDNWGGVVVWENSNRYCSDGSDQVCTLVDPAVFTLTSCAAHLSEHSPVNYYDNCRWRAQNVTITQNLFSFSPANVGPSCTVDNYCGDNGLFSTYGESPYSGPAVPINITFDQNNHFRNNTYAGPWNFEAWSQGNPDNPVNWSVWRANVTDRCSTAGENSSGTCDSGFGQDQGSTLNPSAGPVILSFEASPASIETGQAAFLNVSVAGGVGTLQYSFSGLPPGCSSADTSALRCSPAGVGHFTITVHVNDSAGHTAEAATPLSVSTPAMTSNSGPSDWLWIAVGGTAVAIGIAVAIVLRRRRH